MTNHKTVLQDYLFELQNDPNLSLKDFCLRRGINYMNTKAAFNGHGILINELRHRKRSGTVSIIITTEYEKEFIAAFLKKKNSLINIPSNTADEFFLLLNYSLNQRKQINESLFWDLYDTLHNQNKQFPLDLRLLYRFFLFAIDQKGVKNVFSDKLLQTHFSDIAFRKYLEKYHCNPSGIFAYQYYSGKRLVTALRFLPIENKKLLSIYNRFIKSTLTENRLSEIDIIAPLFERSFGPSMTPTCNPIIDEQSFWTQINFFKQHYSKSAERLIAIRHIIRFYIYYIEQLTKINQQFRSRVITLSLLRAQPIGQHIEQGYSIITFEDGRKSHIKPEKAVVILSQIYALTNRITNRNYIALDFSKITNPEYKDIISSYCFSSRDTLIYVSNISWYLINEFNHLDAIKKKDEEPANIITVENTWSIRQHIINTTKSPSVVNGKLSLVKNVIQWAESCGLLSIPNEMAYQYLVFIKNDPSNKAKAIPIEHATAIAKTLYEMGKNKLSYRHYFVALVLMIETEYRPSEICAIKANAFSVVNNGNTYILRGINKTSKGEMKTTAISQYTKALLETSLKETESIRIQCKDNSTSDFLFIYPPDIRTKNQGVRIITAARLSEVISNICDKLQLPHYTAQNFRDAHMSFAYKYDMDHNGEGFYLRLLSGHRSEKTTKDHYIDRTYNVLSRIPSGLLIGTEEELAEIESRIVAKTPNTLLGKEHETLDNIGVCSAQKCNYNNMISCVLCPHIWYVADRDEGPLRDMLRTIEDNLLLNLPSHEREHQIHLKNAITKRIIAIADFRAKNKN